MSLFSSFKFPAVVGLVCVLFIAAVSCDVRTTKIGDIVGHPRDFAGKEVTISGEVTESFSMIFIKYFMVRDDSGEIAVVTQRTLPARGEKITVKGSVKEAFSIGPETALVLIEKPGTI
ncbi:MAG: hypothetical protein GX642_02605 [Smithella sp.]|jgi:hypothetical protein|nr:hypothetical protein [Smithella sp.]